MHTSIILADDHPLLLEGTKTFLSNKGYSVTATALEGNQAYQLIIKHRPAIAVLDFDMPILNGLEIAHLCGTHQLSVKIVILTLYRQEAIIKQIGKTIHGYIIKEDAMVELEQCISTLIHGGTYVSRSLASQNSFKVDMGDLESLSVTELKILKHLTKNESSSSIADKLFISRRTVEKHRSNIIKKLDLDSSHNALSLWAQRNSTILRSLSN
ncbi:MAG: response regulator transcription factor [Nonlabens sp.]